MLYLFILIGAIAGGLFFEAPGVLPGMFGGYLFFRTQQSREEIQTLTNDVQRLKNVSIVGVAAAVGASVAVSGGIGFVGIVVPHLLRLLIGPDNRYLLPASALLGASLLLVADAVSRTIVAPAELPIGIVTAAVGAPFFLWILLRRRGLLDL